MRLDRRTDGKTWRVCRSPFRQEMALKCHKSLRVINMIFSSSFFFFFFPWDIILGLQQYVDISYAGKCLKIPRKCWYLCWVLIYTNVYRWFFLFPYYVVCIKVDCKCDMLTGELCGSSGSYEHLLINIMRFVFFSLPGTDDSETNPPFSEQTATRCNTFPRALPVWDYFTVNRLWLLLLNNVKLNQSHIHIYLIFGLGDVIRITAAFSTVSVQSLVWTDSIQRCLRFILCAYLRVFPPFMGRWGR